MCCSNEKTFIVGSSDQKVALFKAIKQFQEKCPSIPLDKEVQVQASRSNGIYTFRYASLPKIVEVTRPIMAEQGLALTQLFGNNTLVTMLMHEDGGYMQSEIDLDFPAGITMQEKGSMISYLKRYTQSAILGIVTDEDDDANIGDNNIYQYTDEKKPNGRPEKQAEKKKEKKPAGKSNKKKTTKKQVEKSVFDVLDENDIEYTQQEGLIVIKKGESTRKVQQDEPLRNMLRFDYDFKWDSYRGIWKLQMDNNPAEAVKK